MDWKPSTSTREAQIEIADLLHGLCQIDQQLAPSTRASIEPHAILREALRIGKPYLVLSTPTLVVADA